MANGAFYDGLSEEDQQLVQNAIEVAFNYIVEYQASLHEEALANIQAAKPEMVVNVLSAEERSPFEEAATTVEAAFIEMTGDSGQKILSQMKADLEAVVD
jgi:TRAP-type C4-dicarboxylate transport system substrate-binding protein